MNSISIRPLIYSTLLGVMITLSLSFSALSAESRPGYDYTYLYNGNLQGIIKPDDTATATIFIKCKGGAAIKIKDRVALKYHPKGCDNFSQPDHFSPSQTLINVRESGTLNCGVSSLSPELSDDQNFNVGVCRGVAAAIYGDANKVKFITLTSKERWTALQSGEVDLVADSTLFDNRKSKELGLGYVGISLFDDPAVIVRTNSGLKNIADFQGKTICVKSVDSSDATASQSAIKWLESSNDVIRTKTANQAFSYYKNARCDAFAGPPTSINKIWNNTKHSQEHIVLPDVFRRASIGVITRNGDPSWRNLLQTVVSLVVLANDIDVTSKNILSLMKKDDPRINRLLGTSRKLAKQFGFDNDWGAKVIEQVGNYGEIAIGMNSNLHKEAFFKPASNFLNEAPFIYTAPIK